MTIADNTTAAFEPVLTSLQTQEIEARAMKNRGGFRLATTILTKTQEQLLAIAEGSEEDLLCEMFDLMDDYEKLAAQEMELTRSAVARLLWACQQRIEQ